MNSVWLLTRSVNEYFQYGHYHEGFFWTKPTAKELREVGGIASDRVIHALLNKEPNRYRSVMVEDSHDTWYLEEVVR